MGSEFKPVPRTYNPLKAGSIDSTDTIPHDAAIIRAINSTYTPHGHFTSNPSKTLFVGRLNPITDEDTLRDVFKKFGKIKHCKVVRDPVTLESRRYGFVTFVHQDDCNFGQKYGNKIVIDDKTVLVDFENARNMPGWVPRRLGGGLGGMKGSGQLRFGGRDRPFKQPIILDDVNTTKPGKRRTIVSEFDTRPDVPSKTHYHDDRESHYRRSDSHRPRPRSKTRHRSPRFDRDFLHRRSRSISRHKEKKEKKKKKKDKSNRNLD